MRTRVKLAGTLALVSAAATAAVVFDASSRFAYRGAGLHVALETAISFAAALAAVLVLGRLERPYRLDLLLLLGGLVVVAAGNLCYSALPSALENADLTTFSIWAPLSTSVVSGLWLAAAALTSPSRKLAAAHAIPVTVAAAVVAVGGAGALVIALHDRLAAGVPVDISPSTSVHPLLAGSPALLGLLAATILLQAVAAIGFLARDRPDELTAWVGAACVLNAFARLHYLLFPAVYSRWFYTGDFFRLGFCIVLVCGGIREIAGYWRRLAAAAVADERRRIARDLHDGLAQELAYIAAETTGRPAAAARRALDESRRAIDALSERNQAPLHVAIARTAENVGRHWGLDVRCVLDDGAAVPGDIQEQLVRIVREALTNVAQHAGATRVRVELTTSPLQLRVVDDGHGFDATASNAGFGLVSMRERAAAIGATLTVRSGVPTGTAVEVALG